MTEADRERIEACQQFVRDVLKGYEDNNVGDIDGGWLEDRALELGLIVQSDGEDGLFHRAPWLLDPIASQLSALSEALSAEKSQRKALAAECLIAQKGWGLALTERNALAEALTACQQERKGPEGSFGYCATCYHPLDQCSHCDPLLAEADLTACRAQGEAMRAALREVEALDFLRNDDGVRQPIWLRWNRALEVVRAALSSTPTEPQA